MTTGSSVTFFQSLCANKILNPSQKDELTRQLHHFPEPRALARHLLERNWLTPYQVNQLFLGRSQELMMGSYLILERLGEGGTGQVFKARHLHMQRVVALKLIRPELLSDAEVVTRFYREVRVISQLSHPNVVHAYDAGPIGATHFLVMEYVEGTDLGKLVKESGPLSVEKACDYVRQAAIGLEHAHQRGLVHRDIKPSNLLATGVFPPRKDSGTIKLRDSGSKSSIEMAAVTGADVGVIKVLDLGLALLAHTANGEVTSTLTSVGSVTMGTPDYMAPEQALDFHAVDIRADIYSLGCTLFYLLTGQPPFPGGTMAQKLMRHQAAPPPPLDRYRADVPAAVEAILRRMLTKEPQHRFQTPAEVAAALAQPHTGFAAAASSLPVALPATAIVASSHFEQAPYAQPPAIRSAPENVTLMDPSTAVGIPTQSRPLLPLRLRRHAVLVGASAAGLVLVLVFGFTLLLLSFPRSGAVAEIAVPEKPSSAKSLPPGVTALPSLRETSVKRPTQPQTQPVTNPTRPTFVVIPDDAAALVALRPAILAHVGEARWMAIPWQTNLWSARQKAASLGKPLLLWSAHGHPLGTTCNTGIDFRKNALADAEVQTLLRDFIPVACDGWSLDRQTDAEGEFYRKIAFEGQRPAANTSSRIGLYCATPDSQYLGFQGAAANLPAVRQLLRKALADWNALPEERRRASVVEALDKVDPLYHPTLPTKGAVLNVTTRILEPEGRSWRPVAAANIGQDHMWVTDAETAALVAVKGNPAALQPTLARILRRVLRYHLVDNTRFEPELWRQEQLIPRNLSLRINSQPERITILMEGPFAMASAPNLATAERGFNGHLAGAIVIDLAKEEISQFDWVAVGETWDPARQERAVMGVVLELSRNESDRAFPPYGLSRQPLEYIPPPGK